MANSPQAKKRARQNDRRTAVNKARRSRIRTHLRLVEEAIACKLLSYTGEKERSSPVLEAASKVQAGSLAGEEGETLDN